MLYRSFAVTAILAIAGIQSASAQGIQHSRWQTRYETAGFGWVNAELTLQGCDGHYVTDTGARGRLVSVQVGPPGPGGPLGTTEISGQWIFQNGQQGTFRFTVDASGSSFSGTWTFGGQGPAYRWEGWKIGNGPLPSPVYP